MASAAFAILAIAALTVDYFPIDLTITRAVQRLHVAWFDGLMFALSWVGFMPQVHVIVVAIALALYRAGLRWEAVSSLLAAACLAVVGLIKVVIYRPRPSPELVHVMSKLESSGFPSGHVVETTAFCGFLAFLACVLLKPSPARTTLLVVLGLLVALMGLSRIHQGHHWFSDVMGAYLLGSLWLALTIRIYRRGRPRMFAR